MNHTSINIHGNSIFIPPFPQESSPVISYLYHLVFFSTREKSKARNTLASSLNKDAIIFHSTSLLLNFTSVLFGVGGEWGELQVEKECWEKTKGQKAPMIINEPLEKLAPLAVTRAIIKWHLKCQLSIGRGLFQSYKYRGSSVIPINLSGDKSYIFP